ncbi:hypothetical protein PG987_013374 [Apiospora arundinis]
MVPSTSTFAAAIATALAAIMTMLALGAMPGAAQTPVDKRGIGWLYDYCDDDWAIMPDYHFTGRCNVSHPAGTRDWLSIQLTGCYTVTDGGELAVDKKRVGGMDKRCDRCVRCTDLDKDVCMRCVCTQADGQKHWAVKDLDGDLRVDIPNDRICCGEWWGGPYCGFRGKPNKPALPGQAAYTPTLP